MYLENNILAEFYVNSHGHLKLQSVNYSKGGDIIQGRKLKRKR